MSYTTLYTRVLPRDLFNESKLLKCIGHLILAIGEHPIVSQHLKFEHRDNRDGENEFVIMLSSDGALSIKNIYFKLCGINVDFVTTYNSKSNFPLFCEFDNCEYRVFTEEGTVCEEFIELCNVLK